MKETTKKRKKAILGFKEACGRQWIVEQLYRIYESGKEGFDSMMLKLGRMMAETIMYIEREEIAGPDYMPFSPKIRKWASQGGSVYIGDQKLKKVQHPRVRGPKGEVALCSYRKLKEPDGFSDELLAKVLRGISCRRYNETVTEAADSLLEAFEEILTLHRLKIPGLLRKALHSTNPIESMFSTVRDAEGNIKRYRNSRMMQRWLAAVLLHAEKGFRRIKGYASIPEVIGNIDAEGEGKETLKNAA